MATNVRLKDAAGNVLHPETDWSLVQNKPSIVLQGKGGVTTFENWKPSSNTYIRVGTGNPEATDLTQSILIKANGKITINSDSSSSAIQVKDKNTDNKEVDLDQYPIKWESIKGKNTGFIMFGLADSDYDEDTTDYYPAIRAYRGNATLWTKKFNGSSWTNLDSNETFVGLDDDTY